MKRLNLVMVAVLVMTAAAAAQDPVAQDLPRVNVDAINGTPKCEMPYGADQGAKNVKCITGLPSTGGIADASGALGNLSTSGDVAVGDNTKPVAMQFGVGSLSGDTKYTLGAFSSMTGPAGVMTFLTSSTDQGAQRLIYTGDTGNMVTLPDHAFGVLLRGLNFYGKLAGTSGHGLYSSPGADNIHQFVTDTTLEDVTFARFAQDGVHFEDNIFSTRTFNLAVDSNGRYGWYSAPNVTAVSPSGIAHFGSAFTRNALEQYIAVEGEHEFFGATFSAEGVTNSVSCAKFTGAQANAFYFGVHSEGCGLDATAGAGHVFFNPSNGVFASFGSVYLPKAGATNAPPFIFGSSFNGSAYLMANVIGALGAIVDVTGSFGTIHVFDDAITPDKVTGDTNSHVRYLNDAIMRPRYRFGQAEFNLVGAAGPIVVRMDDTTAVTGSTGEIARRNGQWEMTGNNIAANVATLDDSGNLAVLGTAPTVSAAQFQVKDGGSGTLRGAVGFSNFYETNGFWIQNGAADVLGWDHNAGTPTLMFPAGAQLAAVSGPLKMAGDVQITASGSSPTYYLKDGGTGTQRGYLGISSFYSLNSLVVTSGAQVYGFGNDGSFVIPAGGTMLISGGSTIASALISSAAFNASTGYRVAGGAAAGNVLRGDGSNFVSAALAAGDLSNGTLGTGSVVLSSAISGFIGGTGVGAHTIPIPKLTTSGAAGSISWNTEGVITAYVDPT